MRAVNTFTICLCMMASIAVAAADVSSTPPPAHFQTLTISHSLSIDSDVFTPRGSVSLNFDPTNSAAGGAGGERSSKSNHKAIQFEGELEVSTKAIETLVREEALYRVKFTTKEKRELMAAVPACALVASHFHESFTFHSDPYGTLLSVTYRTPIGTCLSLTESIAILKELGTSSTRLFPKGRVSFGRPGEKAKTHIRPGFDAAAQSAAQAVGAEAPPPQPTQPERAADGSIVQPPQTFWQKYWIYIVGVGAFMIVQAIVAPPEGPPQQGAGQRK